MTLSKTTPESLAGAITSNVGKQVTWPAISTDGAKNAAEQILRLL